MERKVRTEKKQKKIRLENRGGMFAELGAGCLEVKGRGHWAHRFSPAVFLSGVRVTKQVGSGNHEGHSPGVFLFVLFVFCSSFLTHTVNVVKQASELSTL